MTRAQRHAVSWKGNLAEYMTFVYDNSAITYDATEDGGSEQVGLAVTMSADDGVITLVGDGEAVLGKLIGVEADGKCIVQVRGYMTLPAGNGVSSLTLGKKIVGDLGADSAEGYIREVATATASELGLARGIILDDSTTTAVGVLL